MPEVSIIIPTYNRSGFLHGAVQSALNQSLQDVEIIIVDDASQDDTEQVVSSFNDTRIQYIRHEANKGGAAARNTAIRNSAGQYIAFLDDDDEWCPDKLQLQVELMERSPSWVGGVYTGYVVVDRTSGTIRGQKIPSKGGDLSKELLKSNCIGGSSMMLLRKECFDRVGLFDECLPSFQDYDLWIRVAREFHLLYIPEPLTRYYAHENKIWRNLEAISKGLDIMAVRYREHYSLRKYVSRLYRSVGVHYCQQGDIQRGREALWKAIALSPFQSRHYFNLGLSFLGARGFVKVKQTKEKLLAGRREVSST